MKIGIHNQCEGAGIGGSEVCVGVLAAALSHAHQVEVLHHRPQMSREALEAISGMDLRRVSIRCVKNDPEPEKTINLWKHYRQKVRYNAHLSEPYDLFVTFVQRPPPFCHARHGLAVILFPHFRQGHLMAAGVGRVYRAWIWRRQMQTYNAVTVISEFCRTWAERNWGLDCQVFYPPVDVDYQSVDKENIIVSVGRFAGTGVSKQQPEMARAFTYLDNDDWSYLSAGGLSDAAEDQVYFDHVSRIAQGHPIQLLPNVGRAELKSIYERASIFWHAAGFSEDAEAHPHLMEHFGITTVEAMAAGCVPVVVKKGGQTEIVQHGVNGFCWETLEELQRYTALLMQDKSLCRQMSKAARERAQDFSRERYIARFCEITGVRIEAPL